MMKLINWIGEKNTILGAYALMFFIGIPMILLGIIIFIPVLPLMILAFPGVVFADNPNKPTHWTTKPYVWYFNNVWLRIINKIKL